MQGLFYEDPSILPFLLVTVVLGGGAAWMTGRSCALTWRPALVLFLYLLILGLAVRFVHVTVLGGTLSSFYYYLVDTAVLIVIGFVAFRHTRTTQMVNQYHWLNERTGPLSWREIR